MIISGLQKMTLLDFPGKVACTAFVHGCNYRCPFCHNSGLLLGKAEALMDTDAFLAFLAKRKGLLDAVCISGGEPTLQPELPALLESIKKLGFLIKLDTNGTRPDVLKAIAGARLVDYVAMDVKNSPQRYAETAGLDRIDLDAVEESLRFLLGGGADYELRTTVVSELHSDDSMKEMGEWLNRLGEGSKAKALFLQYYVDRDSVLVPGFHAPDPQDMARYLEILKPCTQYTAIRGE